MFKSIKEKLTIIKNSNISDSYNLICEYLLNCIEKSKTPLSKECADYSYCSESVLTSFAKKYGYEGFRELAIRIKVEAEYYQVPHSNAKVDGIFNSNFRTVTETTLDWIDVQDEKINNLATAIKNSKSIYFLSSYQQLVTTELFSSELQLMGYDSNFNIQRKMNPAWLNKATKDDLFIIVAFGLDNQYLFNYYELAKQKTKNIFIVSSISQRHKFDTKNSIIVDYADRSVIWESTRVMAVSYLFSKVLELIKTK